VGKGEGGKRGLQVGGPGVDGQVEGLRGRADLDGGQVLEVVSLGDGFNDARHGVASVDAVNGWIVLHGEADGGWHVGAVLGVCFHHGLQAVARGVGGVLEPGAQDLGDGEAGLSGGEVPFCEISERAVRRWRGEVLGRWAVGSPGRASSAEPGLPSRDVCFGLLNIGVSSGQIGVGRRRWCEKAQPRGTTSEELRDASGVYTTAGYVSSSVYER